MKLVRNFILYTSVGIILSIFLSCIILVSSSWGSMLPPAPALSTSATAAQQDVVTKQVSNYQNLVKAQQDQRTAVFDSVTKALTSIFTAIIVAVLSYVIPKATIAAFEIHKNGSYKPDL